MALDYKGSLNRYRKYLQTVQDKPLLRASFWVTFSLVLIIFMIVFALRPTLITIASLLGQIEQQKTIITQLDKKIVAVQKAGVQLQSLSNRVAIIDEALPSTSNWAAFISSAERMATESGVQISTITIGSATVKGSAAPSRTLTPVSPNSPTLPENVAGISFSISARGTYANAVDFINRIESTRRMIVLTDVQISTEEQGTTLVALRGNIIYMPLSTTP